MEHLSNEPFGWEERPRFHIVTKQSLKKANQKAEQDREEKRKEHELKSINTDSLIKDK